MSTTRKIPMRQCVGCHEMKNKKELLRVIRTPEGAIVLDTTGRKNGRGAYLCCSESCLEKAAAQSSLERSLKTRIPQEVFEQLKEEMKAIEAG